MKPSLHQPHNSNLIKATQSFERLGVDFKGFLPSKSTNKYILTIIDEYSRFHFAFPSATLIKCFPQLLSPFGMPRYILSDRGTSYISCHRNSKPSYIETRQNAEWGKYHSIVLTSPMYESIKLQNLPSHQK